MKNSILSIILIFNMIGFSLDVLCQEETMDLSSLQLTINGEVVGVDGKIKSFEFNVLEYGKLIYTYLSDNGKFSYVVPYNSDVMIEVKAPGYYTKRVAVASNSKARLGDGPELSLSMSLLSKERYPQLVVLEDALDFPSAFVTYDRAGVHYDKNEEFSKVISDEIVKLLPEINYSDSKLAVIDW